MSKQSKKKLNRQHFCLPYTFFSGIVNTVKQKLHENYQNNALFLHYCKLNLVPQVN